MVDRLPPNSWMDAPSARAVVAALEAAGGRGCARFVGGCVRDTLLGRGDQVSDVDIATPLTPPQVVATLEAAGLRAVPTGIAHGTITAIADHKPYEITTLRRDVETDGRRAVVAFTTDWAEDAQRRDFRLNALYADPDGVIHDPTGGGLADVEARRIVFVGDPETRIREDYLRILRFFRFLARVGDAAQADAEGLEACARLRDGVATLSGERIQQEMFKLLGSPDPVPAARLMDQSGVLQAAVEGACDVDRLEALVGLQNRLGEVGDPLLRLAALLPETGDVAAVASRLRLSGADRLRLLALRQAGGGSRNLTAAFTIRDLRRWLYTFNRQTLDDRIRLDLAATPPGLDVEDKGLLAAVRDWSSPPFPVTGEEIKALGVPEGPKVGAVRRALLQWWIDGDFTATKADALAKLERLAAPFRDG